MELLAVCLIKQAKCRTKIILIQVSLSPSSAAICGIHLKKKKILLKAFQICSDLSLSCRIWIFHPIKALKNKNSV